MICVVSISRLHLKVMTSPMSVMSQLNKREEMILNKQAQGVRMEVALISRTQYMAVSWPWLIRLGILGPMLKTAIWAGLCYTVSRTTWCPKTWRIKHGSHHHSRDETRKLINCCDCYLVQGHQSWTPNIPLTSFQMALTFEVTEGEFSREAQRPGNTAAVLCHFRA